MAKRIKARIDTGCVIEQYVYQVPGAETQKGRPRFQTEEERAEHRRKIAWRDHCRKLNGDFAPWELYSTVTFASEQMPRTFEDAKRLRDNYRRRLLRSCPAGDVRMELLGIRGGRWKIEMRSRGIPAAVIHGKWGKGDIWMQTAPPRRKVEYDKSRLVVRCCGRAVRKRPEGWKAP